MTRFPKLSRRKLRLAIRITVSQADRGTKGGTGRCAGCSPSWNLPCRSGWPIPKSVLHRFRAVTPAGPVVSERRIRAAPSAARWAPRCPVRPHRGQPWRERPRDLTASAIMPAATVEVAHATVEWCHRIRRRAQTAPQGTQVLMAFRGGPPPFPERLPTLVFRFRLGNG